MSAIGNIRLTRGYGGVTKHSKKGV